MLRAAGQGNVALDGRSFYLERESEDLALELSGSQTNEGPKQNNIGFPKSL